MAAGNTLQEFLMLINNFREDGRIEGEELRDLFQTTYNVLSQNDTSSLNLGYDLNQVYDTPSTALVSGNRSYTESGNRFWRSKIDQNTGNQPPSDPRIAENTFWIEVSKAEANPIKEWSPGIYGAGLVIVFFNDSLLKLNNPVRPFESVDISQEILNEDWVYISCPNTNGQGGDSPGLNPSYVNYNVDTTNQTDSDPGVDVFKLGETDPTFAGTSGDGFLYISNVIENGQDVSALLDGLGVESFIKISRDSNIAEKILYKVKTKSVDQTGYRRIEVTFESQSSGFSFVDGESYSFNFVQKEGGNGLSSSPQDIYIRVLQGFDTDPEITFTGALTLAVRVPNGVSALSFAYATNDGNYNFTPATLSELNSYLQGRVPTDETVVLLTPTLIYPRDTIVITPTAV